MSDKIAEQYNNKRQSLQRGIKNKIFDVIALAIVAILIALSLGVLERRIITLSELGNIFVECIPFFFTAMLLNDNYYKKGVFVGKSSDNFINACLTYSDYVTKLTGQQIDELDEFCYEFNEDALKKKQIAYLNRASISYDKFHVGTEEQEPVQTWSKNKLEHTYGKDRAKWINLAKNASVKGLQVNSLMGTTDTDDITDLGPTENQLSNKKRFVSAITYALSTLIMSLIAVKNVAEWGWFGIALVIFKCVFIFCKAYMSYFDGYNDVTVHLVNHTNRKTDILKQFLHWYNNRHSIVINIENDNVIN